VTEFDWDPQKARVNLAKHGVTFEQALRVWDDPDYVVYPEEVVDQEQRWHAIGRVGLVTVLLVVHIYRGDHDNEHVRIISARKATPRERRIYESESG
jgi:uncharacterized protein